MLAVVHVGSCFLDAHATAASAGGLVTKNRPRPTFDLTLQELEEFLVRVQPAVAQPDYEIIQALVSTVREMSELLDNKTASIARLRSLLFGPRTEKTRVVLPAAEGQSGQNEQPDKPEKAAGQEPEAPQHKRRKGHGRNSAKDYTGARRVIVRHETLKPGDSCAVCTKGKVYLLPDPAKTVRIVGQPCLHGTVWEAERLRCNLCGDVFTAKLPDEARGPKYDATAGAMIAVLKYGSGLPFYRLEQHQDSLGVPLPASDQWEIVQDVAEDVAPVAAALIQHAAQASLVHNDDTGMKILDLCSRGKATAPENVDKDEKPHKRTGTFTTGIVAVTGEHRVALFFTGRKHAGENLAALLAKRHVDIAPPIQMCDALSRNEPDEFKTVLANCLAHGRRKFVGVAPCFPAECKRVLDALSVVYKNDARAKQEHLSAADRLKLHQAESGPVMADLQAWLKAQLDEKKVEPNSALGKAIGYMLNHWEQLTLFLRVAGAPLDNNVCEQVLKMAILHRKNSLFYKTERGAAVGDLLMGLIYTCRLCGANPFHYLTELLRHKDELQASPAEWLPWNYKAALDKRAESG